MLRIRFSEPLDTIRAARPPGFVDAILAMAKQAGNGVLQLEEKDWLRITETFGQPSGLPIATQTEINHRHAICLACPHYAAIDEICRICHGASGCLARRRARADLHCPTQKW